MRVIPRRPPISFPVPTISGSGTVNTPSSGVFFNPDVDLASSVLDIFDDQNNTPLATITSAVHRPGRNKSIQMTYTGDEDGTDLIITGQSLGGQFIPTNSLFVRSYEMFSGPWEGHWPQGLKTNRVFTTPDLLACPFNSNVYMSEKLLFPGYETSPDPRLLDYVVNGSSAYCHPAEIPITYGPSQIFGNGLPYIRTGHWYKFERWRVLNSGVDVPDGIYQVWIDDVLVLDLSNVTYRSSTGDAPTAGTQFQSMWWGGNYSNTGTWTAPSTLYRYIDAPYASSTKDR